MQDANIIAFDNVASINAGTFRDMISSCYTKTARLNMMCFLGDISQMTQQHGAYPFADIIQSDRLYNTQKKESVFICTMRKSVMGRNEHTKDCDRLVSR